MRLTRRFWLATAVAAVSFPLGAATFAGSAHHAAAEQGEPGHLVTGTVPPQSRQYFSAPSDLTPPPPRHSHEPPKELPPVARGGGPGEDGKPEHHSGQGNGHGQGGGNGDGQGHGTSLGQDAAPAQP
jgi:hypothetical protein